MKQQQQPSGVGTTPSPAEPQLDVDDLSEEEDPAMKAMRRGEVYWPPGTAHAFTQSTGGNPSTVDIEKLRGTSPQARERTWTKN